MPSVSPPSDGGYNYYSHIINDLEEDLKADNKRAKENYEKRAEELEASYDADRGKRNEELERTVSEIRENSSETIARNNASSKSQIDDLNKQLYDKYGRYSDSMENLNFERKRTNDAINEMNATHEHELRKLRATDESRETERQKEYTERVNKSMKDLNDSHAAETRTLRDQIGSLVDAESNHMKEKGQGTADAIKEYEDEWRIRQRLTQQGYENQIGKLKEEIKDADRYYSHLQNQSLRSKDNHFAEVISKQSHENRAGQQGLQKQFDRGREELELKMRRQGEQAQVTLESQLGEANRQKDSALQSQALAYQDTIERQRVADKETIQSLERNIVQKETSGDTSLISPAAEAAVRKSVTKEYEKLFNEEDARNKRTLESMRRGHTSGMQDLITVNESEMVMKDREHATERNQTHARFLEHVRDVETTKDMTLRDKEGDQQREVENLNRNYANTLERQRRNYEELLQTVRNDAIAKTSSFRQEADFKSKIATRAFATRENELIREYHKKLADQKVELTDIVEENKERAAQAIREAEHRNKQSVEEQARTYEQRISQLEYQHKERERYITQNYQDELEKVRRSHALLSKKKS